MAFLETIADAAARPHAQFTQRVATTATGSRTPQFVADPENGPFVAHAGGAVAPKDPSLTVIFAVYVTPAWRGRGLVAALIDEVAAWSRAAGRPELLLQAGDVGDIADQPAGAGGDDAVQC